MKIADKIREAGFLRRENRFACLVELEGSQERAYLPNSGRLNSLLFPGQTVFLAERLSSSRRTRFDLVMTILNGKSVSVDARVPGELVYQALRQRTLPQFGVYPTIRREVAFGRSRLDFLLSSPTSQRFLEVKSVTLVQEGRALFPDAPTLRGRRHLKSLTWAKKEGYEAAILFVIQRQDAESFSANDAVDADFGHVLRQAQLQGVDVYAYRCKVSPREIELAEQVPIHL
jgi:sugar fermentation stimulation protein A